MFGPCVREHKLSVSASFEDAQGNSCYFVVRLRPVLDEAQTAVLSVEAQ
jgi:hypothetical protein